MKKLYTILLLVVLSLILQKSFSQDTNIIKYLPLQVGNVWVYYYYGSEPGGGGNGFDKYVVTGSYVLNGHLYYSFQHTYIHNGNVWCASNIYIYSIRVDSISGNVYASSICQSGNTALIDSLKSSKWNYSFVCGNFQGDSAICRDTAGFNIFGTVRPSKFFSIPGFEGGNDQRYVYGLGIVSYSYSQHQESCYSNLIGCLINGVLYGDTNMIVGLHVLSTEIPKSYSLSQNYPNPFNPTTKIKFDVPNVMNGRDRSLRLVIYDALGKEIVTLVNEQLQPGTYETEWDASNYPSGVYFYQLTVQPSDRSERSDGYTETKKLVLIK